VTALGYGIRLPSEATVSRSSESFPRRIAPFLTVLTAILVGSVAACARQDTSSQVEPQAARQGDSLTASALTSGEVKKRDHESVATLLQARTTGADVTVRPDGSISVRIRGAVSFYGNTEPLYVVDGTPMTPGPRGVLSGINPYDIESIEVLKPPATTIYGVRGANGVVVIKTKRPPR
jgi:TonB-dependent SusC/RagA subfamily outer membrane receptor